jgi:hypothetical protein
MIWFDFRVGLSKHVTSLSGSRWPFPGKMWVFFGILLENRFVLGSRGANPIDSVLPLAYDQCNAHGSGDLARQQPRPD